MYNGHMYTLFVNRTIDLNVSQHLGECSGLETPTKGFSALVRNTDKGFQRAWSIVHEVYCKQMFNVVQPVFRLRLYGVFVL